VERIGPYEILGEVARGGMGVVYKARGPMGLVAVKVLLAAEEDPRFLQEAIAANKLRHPGIVEIHQVGKDEGLDYLVMELVEGESLQAKLERDGPLPVDQAIDMAVLLCDALAYAHSRGVIHRDMKPHNVLLTQKGDPKIADFGLGKVLNQSMHLTKTGSVLGTPAYMPPEQAEGDKEAMGPHSDVYSLGATLYAMLTGRPPFVGGTALNLIYAVLSKKPEPPSAHNPRVPSRLDEICLRCLAKAPEQRYPSVEALRHALRPYADRAQVNRMPALAFALVLLGLVGALVIAAWRGSPQPELAIPEAKAFQVYDGEHEEAGRLAQRAQKKYVEEDYQGVLADLNRALALDPDSHALYASRARVLQELGEFQEALADCDRTIVLEPSPRAYVARAEVHRRLENWRAEIEDYDRAIALSPEDAVLFTKRAAAWGKLDHPRAQLEDAERAIALDPSYAEGWFNRGFARWAGQKDAQGWLEDLTRAVELDPDYAYGFLGRGQARIELGDLPGAHEDFTRAITLKPDFAHAYHFREKLRGQMGDLQGQLEDCTRALALMSSHPEIHYDRGLARAKLGDFEGAVDDFTTANNFGNDSALLYYNRAGAHIELGDRQAARDDYARALEKEPGAPWAAAVRARIKRLSGGHRGR
jgi:tetratricopeptide (TPR) repeat protein/predicted Ser/Thr protein kinase